MAGVHYYNIEQIPIIPEDTRMIAIGTVISVSKEENDTTSTAEVTYYERKLQYEKMPIPKVGDAVQVLGTCLTKPMAGEKKKLFLKIRLNRWRVLNIDQEIEVLEKIQQSRKWRQQKKLRDEIVQVRKKVPIKQKVFTQQQMVDIRSIIFSYTYIVLTNNKDLNSLLFAVLMIKQHSVCKEYAKENQIPDKSMEEGLKRGIAYLLANGIIQQRQPQASEISLNNPDQFIIKRRYFQRLVVEVQQFIFARKEKGATLEQVTRAMNQLMSKYNQVDYLFNWKFIQKVLKDLIDEFRIYKTSDKKLFPYNN